MTVRSSNISLPKPGQARYAGTITAVIAHYDLQTLFGADWNRGQMITLCGTVPFFALISANAGDLIDTASVDASNDEPGGPFAANEHYRIMVQDTCRYIHVVRSGSSDGIMRAWFSSALR